MAVRSDSEIVALINRSGVDDSASTKFRQQDHSDLYETLASRSPQTFLVSGGDADTTLDAVIAGLTHGDTLYFPDGTYTFLTQHTISGKNGITVRLASSAVIKAGNAAWGSNDSFRAVLRFFDCNDLLIEGGTFVGNSADNGAKSGRFQVVFVGTEAADPTTPTISSERVTLRGCRFADVANVGLMIRHVNRATLDGCSFSRINPTKDSPLATILGGAGHRVHDCDFDGGLADGTYDGSNILTNASGISISLSNPYEYYDPTPNTLRAWYISGSFTGTTGTNVQTVDCSAMGVFAGTGTGNWNDTDPEIQFAAAQLFVQSAADPAGGAEVPQDRLTVVSIDHAAKTFTFTLLNHLAAGLNFASQVFSFTAHRLSGYIRDVVIDGCRFRRTVGVGLFCWHIRESRVINCWGEDCLDAVLDIEHSYDCLIAHNTCTRTSGVSFCHAGIAHLNGGFNTRYIGNFIDSPYETAHSFHLSNNGALVIGLLLQGNHFRGAPVTFTVAQHATITARNGAVCDSQIIGNRISAARLGGGATELYCINLDGDNVCLLADTVISDNILVGAQDHSINAKSVYGLEVSQNRALSARTRALVYEPALSARFQNVIVHDNVVRDTPSTAIVEQASALSGNRTKPFVYNNYQVVEGTTETVRTQYRLANVNTIAKGPAFVQIGDMWLRNNGGVLEKSADTTTGADGSWTAV